MSYHPSRSDAGSALPRETREELRALALTARSRAYARYSGFTVGAAILTGRGNAYAGCNVESASYGLSMCAERNALSHGRCEEGDGFIVHAVYVLADTGDGDPSSPCGACCQALAEFEANTVVVSATPLGRECEWLLRELLTRPFTI